jgi:hypothetical protein
MDQEGRAAVVSGSRTTPLVRAGDLGFYDKVQTKFCPDLDRRRDEAATGVRVVPPAVARRGSFIGKNVVLMPSYVNIGAYVDEGTMVDTWASGRFLRTDWQERASERRRGYRRCARAHAGQPHHHRGQLLS